MSDDSTDSQQRPLGQRLKHGLESKILIPAAAAIVTVAVKYLVKKLPMILEEKVLPKLLEKDAPAKVTQAVEGTATALGGTDGDSATQAGETAEQEQPEQKQPAPADSSSEDREAERRKREERRQQRKRGLEKAA